MTAELSESQRNQSARIVALFSVLIHSWQTNDFREAALACDQLEASGIKVKIPRRSASRPECGNVPTGGLPR